MHQTARSDIERSVIGPLLEVQWCLKTTEILYIKLKIRREWRVYLWLPDYEHAWLARRLKLWWVIKVRIDRNGIELGTLLWVIGYSRISTPRIVSPKILYIFYHLYLCNVNIVRLTGVCYSYSTCIQCARARPRIKCLFQILL